MSALDVPPFIKGELGYEEYRTCTRKKRYEEPPESKLKSYHCKFCNGYHLTSKLQRTFKK